MLEYQNLNAEQQTMVDYYLNELYFYGKSGGNLFNNSTIHKSISMLFIDVLATDDGTLYFYPIHLGNYRLKIDYDYFIELCEHTEDDAFNAKLIISTLLYEIVPLIEELIPYRVKAKELLRKNPNDGGNCSNAFGEMLKIEHTNNEKVNDILNELVAYLNNPNIALIRE